MNRGEGMSKRVEKILRSKAVRACGAMFLALSLTLAVAVADIHVRGWEFLLLIRNYFFHDISSHNGELQRNLMLTYGGVVALILAIRRIAFLNRHTVAAEAGHRDGRFEKGTEMMSAGELTARFGGIAALERLAREQPEEYHVQCHNMFCVFVRHRFSADDHDETATLSRVSHCPPEIEAAAKVVGYRLAGRINGVEKIEQRQNFRIDFSGANLFGIQLNGSDFSMANLDNVQFGASDLTDSNLSRASILYSDLSGAELSNADLSNALLTSAYMSSASLKGANLSDAQLHDADLSGANLEGANLSNSVFQGANLTGANLDDADLSGANLIHADLTDASLKNANLSGALLSDANLTGAALINVRNLGQPQLNGAFIKHGREEPVLHGSKCAFTGDPLEWQGHPRRNVFGCRSG